jgi:hypothetical protein
MKAGFAKLCALSLILAFAACGGAPAVTGGEETKPAEAEREGVRWIPNLGASHVRDLAAARGLKCEGPKEERGTQVWTCDAATPLVAYHVEFYGSPSRIEYIRAVVTQQGRPREDMARGFLGHLAGVRYEGAEPPRASEWVEENLESGGIEMFGPVRYRLSGTPARRILDITAPGSDW